ncbi:MAG: hypothetical protein QNJ94_10870 [Alphaproteobacteria bacterium]|nr:hypothetical protein [Alphaproteobacteria bacterium]
MRRMATLAAATSAVAILAACDTLDGWPPPGPEEYRIGFADGCGSGYSDAGRQGAIPLKRPAYGTDAEYKRGWHEGYDYCYDEEQRNPWMGGPETRA